MMHEVVKYWENHQSGQLAKDLNIQHNLHTAAHINVDETETFHEVLGRGGEFHCRVSMPLAKCPIRQGFRRIQQFGNQVLVSKGRCHSLQLLPPSIP